ncbi:MAG: right-handed parallel beta-helix repeat-containing protein, partial [Thermoplasmata archaeon]|nr:right-handed parallel beta-helix repeat-containing protein [Thermoplasmata archaeon]
NNWFGIWLDSSTNCTITNTTANSNNWFGIWLDSSTNCSIANTTMVGNGILIDGDYIYHWNTHTIDTSNTVNGKPVYYWKNINGGTVPAGTGQIILANCTNVKIENQNVSNASVGIEIGFSSHCSIANTTASNNTIGIWLDSSTNCTITNTTANSNNDYGIELWHSTNCTITNTNASNNNDEGIWLDYSSNNTISNCDIYSNNDSGIYTYSSFNNLIYLNNFINNSNNVYSYGSNNTWHSPEPITYTYNGNVYTSYLGNYYDDYNGSDGNGDGIGDAPYYVAGGDYDYYPLMQTWENYVHVIPTFVNITPCWQHVNVNDTFIVNVTVDPSVPIIGMQFDLFFNASLLEATKVEAGDLFNGWDMFFNNGSIDNINGVINDVYGTIIVPEGINHAGTFAKITFKAKKEGISYLNLSDVIVSDANATAVVIEIHNGSVEISFHPWDLNNDKTVNVLDLIMVAMHFGSHEGEAGYDAGVDLNNDKEINILDLIIVAMHFGEQY